MLITFSGVDSSGKSTQIDKLLHYNKLNGLKTKFIWSRGGYTKNFNKLKLILRKIFKKKIPKPGNSAQRDKLFKIKFINRFWLILSILDLIYLYGFKFRFFSILGYLVIGDRYLWDTFVDFKIKFENYDFENGILWKILIFVTPKPEYAFVLFLSAEVSLHRSNLKNEPFSENLNTRKKRIKIYLDLINKGKWEYKLNGSRSISEVWGNIKKILPF